MSGEFIRRRGAVDAVGRICVPINPRRGSVDVYGNVVQEVTPEGAIWLRAPGGEPATYEVVEWLLPEAES